VVEETAVPIVTGYVATIGSYTGPHLWDLFGNISDAAPANHFFEIIVTTPDAVYKAIIPADTCTAPIPTCVSLELTLTPDCDTSCNQWVDIDWTVPAAGAGAHTNCAGDGIASVTRTLRWWTAEPGRLDR